MEEQIIRKIIADALAAGYKLSVWDGEDETVTNSGDAEAVFTALRTTDIDSLYFIKDNVSIGFVLLVYGNDGHDVISDYTTNVEELIAGANTLAEQLSDQAYAQRST
jgi:hypothetical protein